MEPLVVAGNCRPRVLGDPGMNSVKLSTSTAAYTAPKNFPVEAVAPDQRAVAPRSPAISFPGSQADVGLLGLTVNDQNDVSGRLDSRIFFRTSPVSSKSTCQTPVQAFRANGLAESWANPPISVVVQTRQRPRLPRTTKPRLPRLKEPPNEAHNRACSLLLYLLACFTKIKPMNNTQ